MPSNLLKAGMEHDRGEEIDKSLSHTCTSVYRRGSGRAAKFRYATVVSCGQKSSQSSTNIGRLACRDSREYEPTSPMARWFSRVAYHYGCLVGISLCCQLDVRVRPWWISLQQLCCFCSSRPFRMATRAAVTFLPWPISLASGFPFRESR